LEIKPFSRIALVKILEEQLWLAFTESGICATEFKKITTLKDFKKQLKEKTGNNFLRVDSLPKDIEEGLNQWRIRGYSSKLQFEISTYSSFQQKVWRSCSQTPLGKTTTYSKIAKDIKTPKAQRAVGSALGENPIPLLIPCHRVIRNDGSVGEYAYGSDLKELLLEREKCANVLG
jgi:O-6-methylguanine DNA methyltransferase|tara:strand:+ start:993 stop:1517 length:525 start_codon:yes stop_codon:yes gene_type:complete